MASIKSLSWLILTVIFGLLQVWWSWGETLYIKEVFDVEAVVRDGAFLFFSTAVVMSLTVDYFFIKGLNAAKPIVLFCFVLMPFVIILISVNAYGSVHRASDPLSINMDYILLANQIVLFMSAIYCLGVKAYFLYNE